MSEVLRLSLVAAFAAASFILPFSTMAQEADPVARARDLIQQGCNAARERNLEGATELFEQSREYDDTLAYFYLLHVYAAQNDEKAADAVTEEIQHQRPFYSGPKRRAADEMGDHGLRAMSEGKFEEALEIFQTVLNMYPDYTDYYVKIGRCYEELHDTTQALEYFANALLDTMTLAPAATAIAAIHSRRNSFDRATGVLAQALNVQPTNMELWDSLAMQYYRRQYQDEFIECCKAKALLGDLEMRNRLTTIGVSLDTIQFSLLRGLRMDRNQLTSPRPDSGQDASSIDVMPFPIHHKIPWYPEGARSRGIEGTVWVKALVSRAGSVIRASILRSDSEAFNRVSLDAAMQYRFAPAIRDGRPVPAWTSIPFRFKLNR